MTRIREEARSFPLREAVTRALSATGTTITSAGLVLAGTFIVFGIVAGGGSGGSQFRDIAIGLALGILMDTFLVRTLLVPSTVVLLGRWNWWPSKMSRISTELPAGTADTVPAAAAASDHTAGEVAGGHRIQAARSPALSPCAGPQDLGWRSGTPSWCQGAGDGSRYW